jgi:hypothetical protein
MIAVYLNVSVGEERIYLRGGVSVDDPLSVIVPPTFSNLEICTSYSHATGCESIKAGSTDGYLLNISATPQIEPLSGCSTYDSNGDGHVTIDEIVRVVTVALHGCPEEIRFSLIEGSSLAINSVPGSLPSPPEPLSGTFTVVRARPYIPNTVFALVLIDVEFQTPSGTLIRAGSLPGKCGSEIDTGIGCIQTLTFARNVLTMYAVVNLDGREVGLNGEGPTTATGEPSVIENLEVCGAGTDRAVSCFSIQTGAEAGYVLTIFAVREG